MDIPTPLHHTTGRRGPPCFDNFNDPWLDRLDADERVMSDRSRGMKQIGGGEGPNEREGRGGGEGSKRGEDAEEKDVECEPTGAGRA